MPLYEYRCACGRVFEALMRGPDAGAPDCPACGGVPERVYSRFSLGGRAAALPGPDDAPATWAETGRGNRELIHRWRRTLERRERDEQRYPELARQRTPLLSHEGPAGPVPAVPRTERT